MCGEVFRCIRLSLSSVSYIVELNKLVDEARLLLLRSNQLNIALREIDITCVTFKIQHILY